MRYKEMLTEGPLSSTELYKRDNLQTFINKIRNQEQHTLMGSKAAVVLDPAEADKVQQAFDNNQIRALKINGTDGKAYELKAFAKTKEYGGQEPIYGEKLTSVPNRGDVTEGVLGAGTTARLMKRPGADITVQDLLAVIKQVPEEGGSINFPAPSDNKITDVFTFTCRLPGPAMVAFRDTDLLQADAKMAKIMNQIVAYCNDARTVEQYAKWFETNQKPDKVEVVSDGVSDNKGRKSDIYMEYDDAETGKRVTKHFDLSLKAGAKQFGQAGGGSSLETPSLDNWQKTKELFEVFGIDIEPVKERYLKAGSYRVAVKHAYKTAGDILSTQLNGENFEEEVEDLQKFINGIQYHATLNDPNVKLLQFEENKYYLLDFKKLDRLERRNKFDLMAKASVQGNGWPVLQIYNANLPKKNVFISIRPKIEGSSRTKVLRHIIEKGPQLIEMVKVRSSK